jgi:uncharacterized protein (DUF433 family)
LTNPLSSAIFSLVLKRGPAPFLGGLTSRLSLLSDKLPMPKFRIGFRIGPRISHLAPQPRTWNHESRRRQAMAAIVQVDWSECPLVEVDPEIQSGAPVLTGTRLPVSAIVDNAEYGVSIGEISEQFEVSQAQVEAILAYAKGHRIADIVR